MVVDDKLPKILWGIQN